MDSPNDSEPLREIKQMLNLEKESSKDNSENNSSHTFTPTSNVRNGFRRKKGDSPFTYNLNLKVKKEKKQSNFTNPDPWARIVGSRNTAAIYMNGVATTALFDTGAEIQLVSKQFCEDNEWEIQPIEKLTECSTVNGEIFGYEGFVEVNVQIPGRDFSEDHLFLVTSEISHQKEIPVVLGTYFIESLSKYIHGIDKNEFDSLDYTVKQAYVSWVEATRIREKYGCEPPLGFVKITKPVLIQAGTSREIHGLTKVKHGGYAVNCISEPAIGHQLPKGLKLIPGYSPLGPGSCRVSAVVENNTDKDITIPARSTICQLGLANRIPKLIYPGDDCDNDHDPEEIVETDEGLTYKQFEQYKTVSDQLLTESEIKSERTQPKVEIEDIGPDIEEDIKPQNLNSDSAKDTSIEDDGSWILDLIDLSGLDDWPEHLQSEAKEMLKRNARVFSKTDMDMGRTNLVKHHIKLTDPVPFKESYRRIPPQMYDEVKAHIQEMLDLGAIRPSNSPWASAIVLVRKKDGRLRFCIDLRRLNNRTVKDAYSLPKIESILDSLIGAQIFSTLDLKAGYWQVEMAEECKAYTAFTCGPLGFYECDTMPFGATNAPATFQRLMHDCLGDLNMNWCIVYLDDDSGKEMQSINLEADSLVDTKELLEFIDTMDVRDTSRVIESDTQEESVHDMTRQDDIDPKSESQFSSFMSYHEGESSSVDPGTNGQELSKSPLEDSTKRHDSGVVDQNDINSHDGDMIAYESNNTSVPSIDISDHSNTDSQSNGMTDDTYMNPIVEVEPVRRSARQRKQTQFFGNPWLYRITCNLTPRVLSDLLQHIPDTQNSLTDLK